MIEGNSSGALLIDVYGKMYVRYEWFYIYIILVEE